MALGTSVVLKTVDRIIDCENQGIALPTTPQPELAELRPAPKIFKEDCEIRFAEKTAEEIHNFVRGLSPYPAAWANLTINGQAFENVKIYKVEITELRNYGITKSDLIVPCKEGAVRILELQAPGKKRMDAKSFLNGIHA
jgi:methionyl-tRNA formyltransferase